MFKIKKIIFSLVLILVAVLFLDYKGWIKITPKGKDKFRKVTKEGVKFYKSAEKTVKEELEKI